MRHLAASAHSTVVVPTIEAVEALRKQLDGADIDVLREVDRSRPRSWAALARRDTRYDPVAGSHPLRRSDLRARLQRGADQLHVPRLLATHRSKRERREEDGDAV